MKSIIRIFSFVKPYWKPALISLVFLTTVVFLDLSIPRLVQQIIDDGIIANDPDAVGKTALLMLLISVVSTVLSIGNNTLSVRVGEEFARDLREALFVKIQSLSFGNLDRLRTGNLIVRLTSDITILQRVTRMTLRIGTRAPLLMIGSVVLIFNTNSELAWTILPLLIITGILITIFAVKLGPMFMAVQRILDSMNTVLQENIAGIRVVKAFVRKDHEHKRFDAANTDFTNMHIKVMRLMASIFPLLTLMINIGIVIVIWAGGVQYSSDSITIGQIIAFTNYLLTTLTPIMIMANIANVFAGGMVSAERICEVLDEEPEIHSSPQARTLPENVSGKIEFRNVSFFYNGTSNEPVLKNINFTAQPGETIAILGATGSGKSSLVNLIPRFYDTSSGIVLIDGHDVKEIDHDSLLAQIGIALQDTILFTGTIRDNIRYGMPEASESEVVAAAKAAQVHEFITTLPEGYESHVEARGMNLSGGQKQRIAIARAILLKPQILILDDSTSAVDVETETHIQNALAKIMQNRTSFIVAQRISTVLEADNILVLDKGNLVAEGSHNELIETSPIYKEIYDSQLGNGAENSLRESRRQS